jgi:type IVB pilus formation R64 PilN family outer membrane protein
MTRRFISVAVVLALGASACAPVTREDLARREAGVDELRGQLKARQKPDRLYLGSETLALADKPEAEKPGKLPAAVLKPGKVVINSAGIPLTLQEIASLIAAQTALTVKIEDNLSGGGGGSAPPGAQAAPAAGGMPLVTGERMTLPQLLSQICTWFGTDWRFEAGEILLSRYATETYTLASLTTSAEVDTKISTSGMESFSAGTSSSASGGATGSSGSSGAGEIAKNETRLKAKFDQVADIKSAIEDLMGGDGRVSISPALGMVTVTARSAAQRRVAAYMRELNAVVTRQVRVNVQVLSVTSDNALDISQDIGVALGNLGALSLSGATPASAAITGAGELALSVVKGQATGSSAVVKALESVGNVRLDTEGQVITLTGKPAPLVVARQKPYVVGTTTTLYNSGSTTATQIGNLVLGYAMQVLPRVLSQSDLLLHFSVRMTELREMSEFTTGGQTYQQPDVDLRAFTQEARLHSGDTLVLTGFQSMDERASNSGLPVIGALVGGLFGGQTASSKSKTTIVLLVTPYVEGGA